MNAAIALGDVTLDKIDTARDRARRAHTVLRIAGASAVQAFH